MTDAVVERLPTPPADGDLAALAGLLVDAVASGAAVSFITIDFDGALDWWRALLSDRGRAPLVLVARDAEGIVGTVQLIPARAPNQPHRADVAKLIVHRRGRRRGIGRALMRAVEREAAAAGLHLLVLDSKRGDAGERLYRALGWSVAGTIPRYALDTDGMTPHDTVVFYKELPGSGGDEAWALVEAELRHHAKPGDDWIATLNRLWRKNRFVTSLDGVLKLEAEPPVLTREALSVTHERWPLERLAPLLHPDAHGRRKPKKDDLPILVLEWKGRHFLIDGLNRVNRRMRDRDPGPHAVIVIHAAA
jgi:predicted N-acetyltransferase YhbS